MLRPKQQNLPLHTPCTNAKFYPFVSMLKFTLLTNTLLKSESLPSYKQ
uniref:Uncharacterized protein n=1 Tax=Arundo donax TaxID=35708 RepID=A0A0A8Z0M7_ARUDO